MQKWKLTENKKKEIEKAVEKLKKALEKPTYKKVSSAIEKIAIANDSNSG